MLDVARTEPLFHATNCYVTPVTQFRSGLMRTNGQPNLCPACLQHHGLTQVLATCMIHRQSTSPLLLADEPILLTLCDCVLVAFSGAQLGRRSDQESGSFVHGKRSRNDAGGKAGGG